jgi:hypothetical protein
MIIILWVIASDKYFLYAANMKPSSVNAIIQESNYFGERQITALTWRYCLLDGKGSEGEEDRNKKKRNGQGERINYKWVGVQLSFHRGHRC